MTALWTAAAAAAATGGRANGRDWAASGVSIDSRTLAPGDLFIALAGPNHDGHAHVAAALAAGAAAAMVERIPAGLSPDAPLLLVDGTRAGLEGLGRAARARARARIVAVTGSVGKTGTKEMLRLALADQGATHASAGSLNNHWGVPLSLARMPADARFAVFELGMNHPGEIEPLVRMVRPHAAIITTVDAVHTAFFTDTAQIADAKAEIFLGLDADGVAILPRDNPHFHRLAAAAKAAGVARLQTFGTHIEADARLLDCGIDPESTAILALLPPDEALAFRIGMAGRHWAVNALAALLAVTALGGDPAAAARALGTMAPPKGRGERHRVALDGDKAGGAGEALLIDESYNASPVSMRAAIATLAAQRPGKGGRRIAVLGDMLELGEQSPALHANLVDPLESWGIDLVFTAGPLMSYLAGRLPAARRGGHGRDADETARMVRAALRPGDVVMVKGSAGSRMGRVIKVLCGG